MSASSPNMLVYTTGAMVLDDFPRPKVTFLPPVNSNITVMGGAPLKVGYPSKIANESLGGFFAAINRHEVNILGPPLPNNERDGWSIQLELIETLLDTLPFDDINQATLYITGDGRTRLIPHVFTISPMIPFICGVRCVEDIELQVTSWICIGWKVALLDGIPVEVDYAYDFDSTENIRHRVEAMRQLLPLDLTTPLQALLVSAGCIHGVVAQIEEGTRAMTFSDRTLVYSAFAKLQKHHIYLSDACEYEPDDLVIVGDKVRFVRGFTGNWMDIAFIFDPNIHGQETLADARKIHWEVAEKLFEKTIPGTELGFTWASPDFTELPKEAFNILNIVSSPEKPLDMLAFLVSTMSSSDNITSLSKKKRLKGSSSQTAPASRSVAASLSSFDDTCHSSLSEEPIDSSIASDRPLSLSKRSSTARRSVFLYNHGSSSPAVLPHSARLRGASSIRSPPIHSFMPLPPDDSDVTGVQSSHGWLEEVP
ncbi:hypothetical protein EV421DRAFT_1905551 [Armillaria borealis]|uniref:Uncharacterized protein n=1 Tax=Armillaria borealis TaxID=47425 RepID=A0AA39JC83_9AGAR|nr:hypothetical protein EV421DRAFT_1905551 [Armillaria borealis]